MSKSLNRVPSLGGVPRADFLPTKIRELHAGRKNRHNLAISTLIVAALCTVGYSWSQAVWSVSDEKLSQSRQVTERILAKESRYSDIVALVQEAKGLRAAQTVTSQSEVAWNSLVNLIAKSIPEGGSLSSIDLTAPSSIESVGAKAPLTGAPLLVNATITITSPSFRGIEYFLLDARQWPGYSNAVISGVSKQGGNYVGSLTIYLDAKALNNAIGLASIDSSGEVR